MTTSNPFSPAGSGEALVRAEAISKTMSSKAGEISILESITFSVPANSLFAINGPSGSGKSTLLNILTGIGRPSSGRILFAGEEIRKMSENQLAKWRGKHVGIVFQFFQLLPTLTAQENIQLALELGGMIPCPEWRQRALGVIAWLIALVLGIPGAYGFVWLLGQLFLPVPFAFDPANLVVMLAFILLVATLASVGPVWGATRVKIAQTLRYE